MWSKKWNSSPTVSCKHYELAACLMAKASLCVQAVSFRKGKHSLQHMNIHNPIQSMWLYTIQHNLGTCTSISYSVVRATNLFLKYSSFCDHVSSKTPHFKTCPLNTFQYDWGLYPDTLSNRWRHHSDKPITMILQEPLSCDTMGSIQWALVLQTLTNPTLILTGPFCGDSPSTWRSRV